MGNNYEIRRNPKKPDSNTIRQRQDFDALLAKFNAQPPLKRRVILRRMPFYAISAAAALALVLTFVFVIQPRLSTKTPDEAAYFASRPFVSPPLDEVKPAFTAFRANASLGGIFEYPSGSRLVVPVSAFMDDRGKLVEGEVEIHYREIHDFIGLFLTGVPMTYDSAGVKYTLESNGMIEVYAVQNGVRLSVAPGKTIKVELVSQLDVPPSLQVPPGFNVYRLDTATRAWAYQDVDSSRFLGEGAFPDRNDPLYEAKIELQNEFASAEYIYNAANKQLESNWPKPKEPSKPQKAEGNLPTLELDFLSDELASQYGDLYKDAIWQLSPKNQNVDERAFRVAWEDTKLTQLSTWEYELTLVHGQNQLKLIVNPVLTGEDFNRALAKYEDDFAIYQQQMAQREAEMKSEREKLEQQRTMALQSAEQNYQARLSELRRNGLKFGADQELIRRTVINRFEVNELGFWICARPLPPDEQSLSASFIDENGNPLENSPAYLVDKSRNTVLRFLASDGARLNFNRNAENLIWMLTPDHKIALAGPDIFRRIPENARKFTFVLSTVDKELTTEEDIREILISD